MSPADLPLWERRFRAPVLSFPDWSPLAPERLVYTSTESGVWQVHAWDRRTGSRRRITDHPVGALTGMPTLDGTGVLWFQDETGDESGRWFQQPFGGGPTRPLFDTLPAAWNEGLAQAPGLTAVAISDRGGFVVYVAPAGEPPKELYRSTEAVRTLQVYLDSWGSLARTAEVMHLHRNSVSYRLKRIFDLLKVDPDDPDDRLLLQLACRARLMR